MSNDLTKETLYEGVKSLIELDADHIHLDQQKLYTLFSVAFQYMLFNSMKTPGHYIIRVEDSYLLDKLIKKSKDMSTRKFMQKMALPRKLKYGNSYFHLDFFNISTWGPTNDLPKEKIKAALIVKSASKKPLDFSVNEDEEDQDLKAVMASLPDHYYTALLKDSLPETITIAFDEDIEGLKKLKFGFIKDNPKDRISSGVSISSDINLEELE